MTATFVLFSLTLFILGTCASLEDSCLGFQYTPGRHESAGNAVTWQNSYCAKFYEDSRARHEIMESIAYSTEVKNSGRSNASSILSFFTFTDCGSKIQSKRYIEPLYSILRHPRAISCYDGVPKRTRFMMNQAYLILDDVSNPSVLSAKQKVYIDIGASKYKGESQEWMLLSYEARGIKFNRHLMWEARPRAGPDILFDVPSRFHNAYQYMNVPAIADARDERNPLNVLKSIANASDFVVVKLDIDNHVLESQFIEQIVSDPSLASLIDEFFYEPHFSFKPMVRCCWKNSADPNTDLLKAFNVFTRLRQIGIRAHGWP